MAHVHLHDHAHAHAATRAPARRARERRSLLLALAVTVAIMLVEAVGGFISGSLALKADAGHMLTDASALLLAVLAVWFAARPADPRRTFGFYRLEILAALINGLVLIVLALVIAWEAVRRIGAPREIGVGTMLAVACIGLAANLLGLLLLRGSHGSLNVKGAYLHLLGDTLSSLGVIAAAVVILATGWTAIDPVVSIGIAGVIVWSALRLVREAVDVLLEAVPSHLDLAEVLHAMEHTEGVDQVHDLHIWTISSGLHALSAHVVIDSCDLGRNDEILRAIRKVLHDRFDIDHATLQIETPAHCQEAPLH